METYTKIVTLYCIAYTAFARNISPSQEKSTMIVGGIEAEKGEFPFIVGIRKENMHHCGGSIIGTTWIVTAAHCVTSSNYVIVAGDYNNDEIDGTEQNRTAVEIILHPEYDALRNLNDIALIKISPPFEFNEFVQPIQLAPKDFIPPETEIVAGWGRLTENGGSPRVLHKVEVPYVTEEDCKVAYGDRIKDSMTCAGGGGRDACKGDSGSPLICNVEGESSYQILCGCVSWGTGCARPDKYGVYSKISFFNEWISATLK